MFKESTNTQQQQGNVLPLCFSSEHLMGENCTLYVFFLVDNMEITNEEKDPEAFQRFLLASQSFPEGSGSMEIVRRVGVHYSFLLPSISQSVNYIFYDRAVNRNKFEALKVPFMQ